MSFIKKHLFPLILLLIAGILGLILLFYGSEIACFAFPFNLNRNGELLKVSLSVFGGLFVLYGLYVSFLRARAAERAVEAQTLAIANQSNEIELSRESLTSEQFKTAIEHLGSEKEPVILGGIAELNDIAEKFPDKYGNVILDIFCSYVRSEANLQKQTQEIKWSAISQIIRNLYTQKAFLDSTPDLRNCNLSMIELSNCEIKSWNLCKSIMPISVHRVTFKDCDFLGSSLHAPSYNDVHFDNCVLLDLFVEGGYLNSCRFTGDTYLMITALDVVLSYLVIECTFGQSKFYACRLIGCDLGKEEILNMCFAGSGLYAMKIQNSLYGCDFSAAGLEKVEFFGTVEQCVFDGVSSLMGTFEEELDKRLTSFIGCYADTSGIVFHSEYAVSGESQFNEEDALKIVEDYNKLISDRSRKPDKKIVLSLSASQ
ncbi:pentapeptide repeat-containing protein [Salinimicrobium gaetbulicola]|uniref:Pentapeptide repeat-containing protein n=1 Tax=Salinimicrobium gaetbulicola TaxID=999702 RepID=A0ABW3IIB7_9FLAO